MVVQHILSMRMGTRELIDSSDEEDEEEVDKKQDKKEPDSTSPIIEEGDATKTATADQELTTVVKSENGDPILESAISQEISEKKETEAVENEAVTKEEATVGEDKPQVDHNSTDPQKTDSTTILKQEEEEEMNKATDTETTATSTDPQMEPVSLTEPNSNNIITSTQESSIVEESTLKTSSSEQIPLRTGESTEALLDKIETPASTQAADSSDPAAPDKPGEEGKSSSEEVVPPKVKKIKETRTIEVEEFFVKYKSFSYLHCEWKTEEELMKGDKRVNAKIKRYKQKLSNNANIFEFIEEEPFNPDYIEVDRVLDKSEVTDPTTGKVTHNYLVKWRSLPYDEATWELVDDIDPEKLAQFHRFHQYPKKDQIKPRKRPKPHEWCKIEESPVYNNANTLREYQLEGLNWLSFSWFNGRNCILADEMGLGKTIQSLTFVEQVHRYGIRGPFLVIAPLSTVPNWQREFETWTDLNIVVYHGSVASRNMIQEYELFYRHPDNPTMNLKDCYKFNVLITTFEIVLTDVMELKDFPWRVCVIDEAHRLKNKNCKLLEGLRLLNMEHRVLLSGTPLQNNVQELFSLLNFLEPSQFSSDENFIKEFGDLKSETQVQKLQALLKPMMLRRLKEDVEKSIAPKEETIVEVELTNMQKKYYRAILERNFSFLSKGTSSANIPNLMNTMMELRKCCIHPYLLNGKSLVN